jgi:serine/threonine-protein kinase
VGVIDVGLVLDDRYRIVARRAAGATATVWETEDEFLRRRVALKILHDHLAADADFLDRFIAEARTAATVNHPNLVAVYDSIRDHPGIVLEWIDGPDLRQRLDQGPLPPEEASAIGGAICDGLAALHAHGLVHRDVKPANILLTTAGTPKLTDFGIATANAGDRTATGVVLGTAKYLAPEQVRGTPLDGRADVFALAAVLYETVTGTAPWHRDGDLPTALARLDEDAPDLRVTHPHLPAALTHAVMRGLRREPAERWADAAAFGRALREGSSLSAPPPTVALAPPASPTVPLPPPPAAPRARGGAAAPAHRPVRPRRKRWPRVLGTAIVVAIAVLGWTLLTSIGGGDDGDDGAAPPASPGEGVTITTVEAFDPEGTGTPGEHDDRAVLAIDGNPSTAWTTERYESRDLGTKSGVGLVLSLDTVTDVSRVDILTGDARGWAVEIRVAEDITTDGNGITAFGDVVGSGADLEPFAEVAVRGHGDTVVVWFTDLGDGALPVRLTVSEITVR